MTRDQPSKRNPAEPARKQPETPPSAPSRGAGAGGEGSRKKPATDEAQPKWPGGGPKGEDEPEPKRSPN